MKNIIVYTPYACLLKCANQELELDENEHAIIEDSIDKIDVYPVGKTKKYSFLIDLKEKNNKFYSIIEKDDKILIFLLDGLLSENVDIYHLSCSNKKCDIELAQNSVTFISDNHKKQIFLNELPLVFKCGNFLHICYALLTYYEYQILIAYNIKTSVAKHFRGDKISLTDSGFIVQSRQNGCYEKIEQEYYVDQNGLKNKSKSSVLSTLPKELVPYQFMQSVKDGDTKHVKEFLSDNLKEQVSVGKIQNYFGKISYFYMIDNKTCFALSNGENVLYEFSVINGKIDEIIDSKNN